MEVGNGRISKDVTRIYCRPDTAVSILQELIFLVFQAESS